jgi:hypothetical protein
MSVVRRALGVGGAVAFVAGLLANGTPTRPAQSFADVQKVLTAHCTRCHSGDKAAAALRLDSFDGVMKGGASGAVVVPGKSWQSVLMGRLAGEMGLPQMPLGFVPLSAREMSLIADWIDAGAKNTTATTKHWAYTAPIRPSVPTPKSKGWVRNPIDAFVLARLEQEGFKPSPEADRTALVRRATLDLTGLPPTTQEVDAFLADRSPDAYEKLVERLLASPNYGERMALPWLDAARYADSNGFQQDGDTHQWVWRDWVVDAMNANMPFDQFTIEQLAGDLLPDTTQATSEGRKRLIATAFNRNHMLNGEGGAIPEEQRNVNLFDRVETTATTWLGLTMTCTRCHDHKYDPLTQRDYFSLMAYFNSVPESGVPEGGGQYRIAPPWIYAGSDEQMKRLHALQGKVEVAEATKNPDAKTLGQELDELRSHLPRVMVMSDRRPRETHVLNRGNYEEPMERVNAGTPALFEVEAQGDRLALARWIVDPRNPLTARVAVNRYWQTFFGRGLVRTPENFGVQGEAPTHPELLDWLATEFVRTRWDVKHMHRLIVTSATYRQSSRVTAALHQRDPDNRLLARGARFRLPAMILRDVALASSGLLEPEMGGKPVYPYQPQGIWDGLAITLERDFTYPQSHGPDLYRRSIYTFWRRTVVPGNMFDASVRNVCSVQQWVTSTPLHALTTLNDPTWVEAGRVLAQRVMTAKPTADLRLDYAFRLVCARKPSTSDMAVLRSTLATALSHFRSDPSAAERLLEVGESKRDGHLNAIDHAAYATVCHMILNLDEAMTRE